MSEQNEKISSMLDEFAASKLDHQDLDALLADVNLRNTVGRYQLIGDVLRNEVAPTMDTDFAAELRVRIDAEESHRTTPVSQTTEAGAAAGLLGWLFKPVAGFAVAAAVAVVTISVLQPDNEALTGSEVAVNDGSQARIEQLTSVPVVQRDIRTVSTGQGAVAADTGMTWKIKRNEAGAQSKLNQYLINHNEFSNSMNGIIPQARVVGFDGQN